MALRSGKAKNSAASNRAVAKPVGSVRRAQQITTYGVGALTAIGDQSYIIAGLNSWKDDQRLRIDEPRLQHALRVDELRWPPADDPSSGRGIAIKRFPMMYSCKTCGDLQPYRDFASSTGKCNVCSRALVPSRFISACKNGHLDEFPYDEWVHYKTGSSGGRHHRLKITSTGESGSLRSIIVSCTTCGVEDKSMEGALAENALAALGIKCYGRQPWLGKDADVSCDAVRRGLQRGSSAAWFPVVRSALSIPPYSTRLIALIEPHFKGWQGESADIIARMATKQGLVRPPYTAEDVVDAVRMLEGLARDLENESGLVVASLFATEDVLRPEEYRQLCATTEETPENSRFVCVPPEAWAPDTAPPGIAQVMLAKRLREVRALTSFTRVEMPLPTDGPERRAKLSRDTSTWLPAIEVIGEGVFLRLDPDALSAWEQNAQVQTRTADLRRKHNAHLARKVRNTTIESPVTPRFVLIHTLAHALINEWSLDAGYPAAALRERLYIGDDIAGMLIYTATSDSAGSLGGLVAQGDPRRLRSTFEAALERVSWCSADPLCMESEASGADSLNLAACHACVLLPEVSCELNNTLLDRAMLIGVPDGSSIGYFRDGESR